jgi:hypothetical protein
VLEAGATDVFCWNPLRGAAAVAARLSRWWRVTEAIALPSVCDRLIGTSAAWRRLLRRIVEIARFTDSPALIPARAAPARSWSRSSSTK